MPRDFSRITNAINELRAERYLANRAAELHDFFTEYEQADACGSWLAEREHELQITQAEWDAHRAARSQAFRGDF